MLIWRQQLLVPRQNNAEHIVFMTYTKLAAGWDHPFEDFAWMHVDAGKPCSVSDTGTVNGDPSVVY